MGYWFLVFGFWAIGLCFCVFWVFVSKNQKPKTKILVVVVGFWAIGLMFFDFLVLVLWFLVFEESIADVYPYAFADIISFEKQVQMPFHWINQRFT